MSANTKPQAQDDIRKELREMLSCLTGACFHSGSCIYWESLTKEGEIDHIKLHSLAEPKLLAIFNKDCERRVLEAEKIDHNIDVRYAPDLLTMFNRFIEKWCSNNYAHLIDSDENDAQFIRNSIKSLQDSLGER